LKNNSSINVDDISLADMNGFWFIAEQIAETSYRSRKRAEGIAERFEAFVVQATLEGKHVGTIATKVVPRNDGWWTIKIDCCVRRTLIAAGSR
jgi:hypothetical protein